MSSSWGWRIVEWDESRRKWVAELFGGQLHTGATNCRKKGCQKAAECYVSYRYVTGRAGRASSNEKPYCREHAEAIVAAKLAEAA